MTTLSTRLKASRGNRSQAEFARLLGLTQQRYANYEGGVREPDLTTLCGIASKIPCTTDWLLGLSDRPPNPSPPDRSAELKREIEAVLRRY